MRIGWRDSATIKIGALVDKQQQSSQRDAEGEYSKNPKCSYACTVSECKGNKIQAGNRLEIDLKDMKPQNLDVKHHNNFAKK
jgi:hypothetical protein